MPPYAIESFYFIIAERAVRKEGLLSHLVNETRRRQPLPSAKGATQDHLSVPFFLVGELFPQILLDRVFPDGSGGLSIVDRFPTFPIGESIDSHHVKDRRAVLQVTAEASRSDPGVITSEREVGGDGVHDALLNVSHNPSWVLIEERDRSLVISAEDAFVRDGKPQVVGDFLEVVSRARANVAAIIIVDPLPKVFQELGFWVA